MSGSPPGAESAGEFFAALVGEYDSLIRRAVPRYAEMTERLVRYLPASAARILELGCGTGNLSLALARKYPTARFTFVDAADEMLIVTRQRISGLLPSVGDRATFAAARFEQLTLGDAAYDLVVSSISLHHVADKEPLFRTLRSALSTGGRFCFSDQMRADPPASHERNWEEWLAFCRLPGNCTEDEIASLLAHAEAHDHYESVGEHLRQLATAGFAQGDCLWRHGMWAIVSAIA